MRTLQDIWKECERICSRNLAGRFLHQSNDKGVVGRLSRRLDSAMVMFNFQSLIEIQEAISKYAKLDSRQKKVTPDALINSTGNSNNNVLTIAGDNSRVYTNAGTYNTVNYNYLSDLPKMGSGLSGRTSGSNQIALQVDQLSRLAEWNPTLRGFLTS
ncbi:hypothetical protein CPB84DRAFT_1775421 [Gymnopilus junonius]|uniref:Uncharacterized protein n=1 Tax=Gymnopilus junonius TaxID=109634 RepID=A0A9P5TP87_GYMJU|nr:hypothetical protein CPB84DRAFT_1775421 [Gymnopilus junonius]